VQPDDATAAASGDDSTQPAASGEKNFTQQELDEIVQRRLAKERRKAQKPAPAPAAAPNLKIEDFESPEAYATALAEHMVAQRSVQQQEAELTGAYQDREEAVRDKYDDFEQVAYNPRLPITETMALTIRASEIGPEVLYQLGKDPKEAERISKLPPFLQAKEIGKMEAKLSAAPPPTKRTTSAPAPIVPVTGRASAPVVDTTDPRSIQMMTTSEWINAERQRTIARLRARQVT
jgi:hypothetical protein